MQAIDVVLESASALSLKYIAIQRAGAGSVPQLIPKLMYHLLVQGIAHEHQTGLAPLPGTCWFGKALKRRAMTVWYLLSWVID